MCRLPCGFNTIRPEVFWYLPGNIPGGCRVNHAAPSWSHANIPGLSAITVAESLASRFFANCCVASNLQIHLHRQRPINTRLIFLFCLHELIFLSAAEPQHLRTTHSHTSVRPLHNVTANITSLHACRSCLVSHAIDSRDSWGYKRFAKWVTVIPALGTFYLISNTLPHVIKHWLKAI